MNAFSEEFCRLCLETSSLTDMFSPGRDISISEKAMVCLDIQVRQGEQYPPLICQLCEEKLDYFYDFRLKCRMVENQLKWMGNQHCQCCKLGKECVNCDIDDRKLTMKPESSKHNKKDILQSNSTKHETCIDNVSERPHWNSKSNGKVQTDLINESNLIEKNNATDDDFCFDNLTTFPQGRASKEMKVEFYKTLETKNPLVSSGLIFNVKNQTGNSFSEHPGDIAQCNPIKNKSCLVNFSLLCQNHTGKAKTNMINGQDVVKENKDNAFCIDNCTRSSHRTLSSKIKVKIEKKLKRKNPLTRPQEQNPSKQLPGAKLISVSVQCELCGKIFKHKTILEKHLRSHSGVKLFSCKICNKRFTRAEHERVHMRAHRGVRPFICDKCARAFTKRQDLLRHMRIHSEEKKYGCPRCERRFKRAGDVRSHLRSHTGARPYSCGACHNTYTSHSGLKKHARKCIKKEKLEHEVL